jgi:recombinational DNA repair ATPase RecF
MAETENPEVLRQEEMNLTVQLSDCSEQLLRQRQHRELLLAQIQQLPELRDQLQQWQEKKRSDQNKSDLLDDTMTLLEQAKENLSGAYLEPIRRSFSRYLEKLWSQQEGQVLVTPDLEVQLERGGAVRELAYFSAGQTDAVMLCMRLALVDALFAGENPFVILDDPFINLDNERTKQALLLLRTLSENRQIIYLTCNSSRIPQ